ncbi:unnamed protein product, partial [Rotaria sp. Silwood2]
AYVQNIRSRKNSKTKRKRQERNPNDQHANRSLSQLSISQEKQAKKQKLITTVRETTILNTHEQPTHRLPTELLHDNMDKKQERVMVEEEHTRALPTMSIQKFKPQYLQVSNRVFKTILSSAIPDANKIVHGLNTNEKLQMIRQMTEIRKDLHYFQLQQNLWQAYYNLGIKENIDITIRLAKRYWQIVVNVQRTKEQLDTLRQRIFLQRLPRRMDKMIDLFIDYIQPMLSSSVLNKDRRAGLTSSYSKIITRYKFDLMSLNMNTLENIERGHQQLLIDFKKKILQACNYPLRQAIE